MNKKITIIISFLLLTGINAFASVLDCQQVTGAEVTNADNTIIRPGGILDGLLIFGTQNTSSGAQILSSTDGVNFTVEESNGIDGSDNTEFVIAHQAYLGSIYAWATNSSSGTEVWKSVDGSSWTHVTGDGLNANGMNGDSNNNMITGEVITGSPGTMYVGVANWFPSDYCSIWAFDGTTWTQNATAGAGDFSPCPDEPVANAGSYFKSRVYFGTYHTCSPYAGGLYYTSSPWTVITSSGFGDTDNYQLLPAYTSFGGYLYVGSGNSSGAQIWRSLTGDPAPGDWTKVVDFADGTGVGSPDAANTSIQSFSIPGDGYFYCTTYNSTTGTELWRTDGSTWEQINTDGFEYINNTASFLSRTLRTLTYNIGSSTTTIVYLFAGTGNTNGAQLWKVLVDSTTTTPPPEEETAVLDDTGIGESEAEKPGEIVVVGNTARKGIINPDEGDVMEIHFRGDWAGKYTLRIFTLLGELVYDEKKDSLAAGKFSWFPKDIASGIYIVHVEGPGVDIHKKVAILR